MSQLVQILQGWSNLTLQKFNLLDKETQQLGEKRLLICDTCPMRINNTCSKDNKGMATRNFIYKNEQRYKFGQYSGCGCNLSAKGVSPQSCCPCGYWLDKKQQDEIDSK